MDLRTGFQKPYLRTVAPRWVPDKQMSQCPLCTVGFSMFRRRSHCRNCGTVCCAKCSDHKLVLSFAGPEPVRVCRECALGLSWELPAKYQFRLSDQQRKDELKWLEFTAKSTPDPLYSPGRMHHDKVVQKKRTARLRRSATPGRRLSVHLMEIDEDDDTDEEEEQQRQDAPNSTTANSHSCVPDQQLAELTAELRALSQPPRNPTPKAYRSLLASLYTGLSPSLRPFVWPLISGSSRLQHICPGLYDRLLAVDLDETLRNESRTSDGSSSVAVVSTTKTTTTVNNSSSTTASSNGLSQSPSGGTVTDSLTLATPPPTPVKLGSGLPSPFAVSPLRPSSAGYGANHGPPSLLDTIRADVGRTLPSHPAFRDTQTVRQRDVLSLHPTSKLAGDESDWLHTVSNDRDTDNGLGGGQAVLLRMLHAFAALCRSIGYAQGMSYVAAVVLLQAPDEETAFWMFVATMRLPAYDLAGLFSPGTPTLRIWLDHFATVLERTDPELATHFGAAAVYPETFAQRWFKTCFVYDLPLALVFRLWDVFLVQGPDVFIKAALGILILLRERLLPLDAPAILAFLKDSTNIGQINADDLMDMVFEQEHDE